ncbi:Nitrilase/cyanide hydratase and apolipoprotein N-acyltransferase [Rhizobium sp. CF080]|uniref:conjugal transfer protein TraB n=1 Tax=Rhizobium sp. (strain CF080) TaxID=1144310 RepID=UPI0002715E88|nr:conjugal transfer protein TraB [Rhizobium sp. CF080]EUB98287.1 Nitrilase/cyanide hydratase and apolipoprotein N-acyltransferase [Rhizobium sp. CF080]
MRPEFVRSSAIVGAATASGLVGWSGQVLLMPATLAFPLLWSIARKRRVAALVAAAYFLAASRELPQVVATFYMSDPWLGLALWLVASAGFVAVHTALWSPSSSQRPARYLAAILLMSFPPFGIVGWAHPITAAGVLFPDWGWWGLAVMTVGLTGLVSRKGPVVAVALGSFWLWSVANWTDTNVADTWRGVDLQFGASLGRQSGLQHERDLIAIVRVAASDGAHFIVLPESGLGLWTPTKRQLWLSELSGSPVTIIAGAVVVNGNDYDNVLVTITGNSSGVLYRERMPVPGAMWQPWLRWSGESGGARAYFFANPVVKVGSTKIAPLICYEQLIVWPVLQSMLGDPDVLLAVGNGWWARGMSIVDIQRASTIAWARLFSKPLVLSFNT